MDKFKFWLENRTDKEYTLTAEDLKTKYREFLSTKEKGCIEYYNHQTIFSFIGDKDGLNSVSDNKDNDAFVNLLMEVRHEFY